MMRPLAVVLLAALVASCTRENGALTNGRHSWTQPEVLRVAIQQDLKNLDPLLNSNTTDVLLESLMFEPLVTANPKGQEIPMLAAEVPNLANGGISRDGLTITYHLRRNVSWTDGVAVTSHDVKWSWQAIMNPDDNVVSRHGYDEIRSIDTPDPYTVVVHLKERFSPFVDTFFAPSDQPYAVAPAHVLESYPNINQVPFNSDPSVTDGPFRFEQWVHGDHITLMRNDRFFMGKPHVREIDIRIIPDENTSVNLLASHAIDWMFQASIETYPQVSHLPNVRIVWMNVNGYEDIQFNDARPLLKDPRVRQAIAYAIDKRQLIETLTYGQEREATEDIPYWMWAFDPAVHSYPYDPAKARALLAQAGWTPGPDGTLQKNGQPLVLVEVTDNSNVTRREESIIVQNDLRKVGIRAELHYYPGDVLFAPAGEGGVLQLGRFDLSLAGWFAGIDPDDSAQYMCKNFPPGGYNYDRYCNAAMDAAETQALRNFDRSARVKAYATTQTLLHDDMPELFIYWLRYQEPISVDFKGLDPNPVDEAWNAWQWSI